MLWGVQWYSKNKLDGANRHIIYVDGLPALFRTKRKAVEFIDVNYGYIRNRRDLRGEPHGWRIPKPIKVKIQETK